MANADLVVEVVDEALSQRQAGSEQVGSVVPFSEQVRSLRQSLKLTQEQFAERFSIPIANVRNWEQTGRSTKPDTAARLLIAMIAVDPEKVANIIAQAKKTTARSEETAA